MEVPHPAAQSFRMPWGSRGRFPACGGTISIGSSKATRRTYKPQSITLGIPMNLRTCRKAFSFFYLLDFLLFFLISNEVYKNEGIYPILIYSVIHQQSR